MAAIAEIADMVVQTLMIVTAILAPMAESNSHSQLINLWRKRQMLTWIEGEGGIKMLTSTDTGWGRGVEIAKNILIHTLMVPWSYNG